MSIKQQSEIMLQFVWCLAFISNTATILKYELEDEWTSNQSESSLQNYTMSDLQVRLYVLGIPDINIVENIKLC